MAKILVVDDEELTVEMLSAFLGILGHETIGALSGRQTRDKLAYENPDAVLLDIMLPDAHGVDLCKELREMPQMATLPIIMISAHLPPLLEEAKKAGATDYLIKPIRLPALNELLAKNGIG